MNDNAYIIVMAGGVGTRFWPISRQGRPKQFIDVLGIGASLLQDTVRRFETFVPSANIFIVTNDAYVPLVQEQLPQLSRDQILAEPVGRDTAPCVAYACYKIRQQNPDAVFCVSPADHLILDDAAFAANIQLGLETAAAKPAIVTLGITPTRPDTGYGYIQFRRDSRHQTPAGDVFRVKTFTEKPSLEIAKEFVADGSFVWNSGIFLFSMPTIISAFETHLDDVASLFAEIAPAYFTDAEPEAIRRVYGACRKISMDYGIMEKAKEVYVIPAAFRWSDLGTWGSVYDNSQADAQHNVVRMPQSEGNVAPLLFHAGGNIIAQENPGKIVAIDGLEGYIVVDTPDALLICRKSHEQFVKQIVTQLQQEDSLRRFA